MSHGRAAMLRLMPIHPRVVVAAGLGIATLTGVVPLLFDKTAKAERRVIDDPASVRARLAEAIDALAVEGLMPPGPIDLAGYSGGAQFAHRFAWLHPAQTARLTVAAAGWWTFPDAAPFPYGCGPSLEGPPHVGRCLAAGLPAFLDRDIVVAVGARDDAPDAATRRGPELDAQQGTDRLARARRWVAAMAEAAEALGAPRRPRLVVLPGCGHDVFDCLDAGLDKLILPAPSAHR